MHANKYKSSRRVIKRPSSSASSGNGWLYVLIAYYGFEYVRFQDSILSFLSPLKIPMFLTLALALYVVLNLRRLPKGKFTAAVLLFWVLIIVWVPFATNNFHAFQTAKSMSMIYFTVFATVLILDSFEKVKIFAAYFILFITLVAAWVLTHGGKGPGGFVADENDVALVIIIAIPFTVFLAPVDKTVKYRLLQIATFLIMISAVILTSSRGGFLGLIVVFLLILWTTKKRLRNFGYAAIGVVLLGGVLVSILPDGYVEDMQSISDTEDSTRNLRFLHWTTAVEVFKDNPVFGVGPNNYPWTSNQYFHLSPYFVEGQRLRSGRASHSLYFTLIPELGVIGILLFLALLFDFRKKVKFLGCRKIDNYEIDCFSESMAKALFAAMGGFLSAGAFISVLYYPIFWHLIAITTAVYLVFEKRCIGYNSDYKGNNQSE